MKIPKAGTVFIVSAPSGAGKTSLIKEVINRIGDKYNLSRVKTYTTRTSREGEVNNSDYHFVSRDEFKKLELERQFLETTEYNNQLYGSPYSVIEDLKLGKSFIFVIDRNGAKSLHKIFNDATSIWINTPDLETLKNRIAKRGSESPKQIEKRLEIAEAEIKDEEKHNFFTYHVINKVFDTTVNELISIIEDKLK